MLRSTYRIQFEASIEHGLFFEVFLNMSDLSYCLECGENYKGLKNDVGSKCLNHKCKGNNKENQSTVFFVKYQFAKN